VYIVGWTCVSMFCSREVFFNVAFGKWKIIAWRRRMSCARCKLRFQTLPQA
jgi:hypothetical protein